MPTASTTSPSRPLFGQLVLLGRDIKLSHSVFALPFALLATFLAAGHVGSRPSVATLALIIVCMVLARTTAMAINRWADRHFDAANPRTAGRAIPRGALSADFVLMAALASAAGFVLAAGGFWLINANPWPMILSPLVLLWLAAYSFTKRFTMFCHLFLGSALALSPLAATIAVEPAYLAMIEPYLLAMMVLCWVAGFDVIYALQDVSIDREQSLFSLPSRLGAEPALWVSRLLHVVAGAALIALAFISPQLGVVFFIASVLTVGLLVLEHALVWGSKTHRIHTAFLTVNGLISLLLGAAGIVDALGSTA